MASPTIQAATSKLCKSVPGGGVRMRGLAPKFTRKRAYLIFPVRGSERRGLVSVEAKKRKGKVSTDQPGKSHHGPKREQERGLRQRADVMVGNEVVREDLALLLVPSSCTSFLSFVSCMSPV